MNVVTACSSCNHKEGGKSLKESGMELRYVPYEPNHYESLILQNRNILADQMDYLISGVPKHSRILQLAAWHIVNNMLKVVYENTTDRLCILHEP